jgi:hypothetical protein
MFLQHLIARVFAWPAAIASLCFLPAIGQATPSEGAIAPDSSLSQVTSVSQLSDVQPTDWSFQALQSLVERYGCIAGYPDKTFRGNRTLTRYEFAAGLNACMNRINEILAANTSAVPRADIENLQKLQTDFAAELTALRGRIDSLEARTQTLEAQQFSTNTKLTGFAAIGVQGRTSNAVDLFPVDGTPDTPDPGNQINVTSNVQLNLTTQLSSKTILNIGLQAGSGSSAPSLSQDVALAYENDSNNTLRLSDLTLQHLLSPNFAIIVGAEGVNPVSVFRGPNRFESAFEGPLSRHGQRNPILNGGGRAGVGFDWQISSTLSLQGLYATNNAASPTAKNGLFNGQYTAGLQLAYAPSPRVDLALYGLHSYNPDGVLGYGVGDSQITPNGEPINTTAIGTTLSWRASRQLTLGGWLGWSRSTIPGQSGGAETLNWMAFANFPDLFGRGNLGGIYVGQPPRITSSTFAPGLNLPNLLAGGTGEAGGQSQATTHVEVFYRMRLSDNISVTPGVIAIFNQGNAGSDPVVIGAVRTSFSF